MKLISDEDLHVGTLAGYSSRLEAGVPKEITIPVVIEAALQLGARIYDEPIETPIPQNEVTALTTILEKIMDEGDPKNFRADGYPKAAAVNTAAGRNVPREEREEAWDSILNS